MGSEPAGASVGVPSAVVVVVLGASVPVATDVGASLPVAMDVGASLPVSAVSWVGVASMVDSVGVVGVFDWPVEQSEVRTTASARASTETPLLLSHQVSQAAACDV